MSNKEGSFKVIGLVMILSLIIAAFWDQLPWLKNSINYILDPSAGFLLRWDLIIGMLIIVFIISLLTTIIQKYATDQKALKELKKDQKAVQEEMKKFKDHPEKLMELQKKQMEFIPKMFKLSTRALAFTGIPFILFFRWFNDYFISIGNPPLWFMSWFIFYLITTLIFSGLLKKWMDVV